MGDKSELDVNGTCRRIRFIAAVFIFAFIISSVPFVGAGSRDEFSFVLIKELKGEVVDNETGVHVENVTVWGEVHSTALYFKVEISDDSYSYQIFDSSFTEIDSGSGTGIFVIPVSRWLEPGVHTYSMTAYADNYSDKQVSGTFSAGEGVSVRIEMEHGTGSSVWDFGVEVSPESGTITREWREGGTTTTSQTKYRVTYSTWGQTGTSTQNTVVGYTVNVEKYENKGTTIAWQDTAESCSSSSSSTPSAPSGCRWVSTGSITQKISVPVPGYWQDTGEKFTESWGNGKPALPSGYQWVEVSKGYTLGVWTTTTFKKQRWVQPNPIAVSQTTYYYKKQQQVQTTAYEWVSKGQQQVSTTEFWSPPPNTRYYIVVERKESRTVASYGWVSQQAVLDDQAEVSRYESAYGSNGGWSVTSFSETVTETVTPAWVSNSAASANVTLTPSVGYSGDVVLSVDVPSGINWELTPVHEAGNLSGEVVGDAGEHLDNATIFGTVTSSGSTRVHLSGVQPAVFTLKLEVPESASDAMTGSYTVTVMASDGNKSDSKTFTLNVVDESLQNQISNMSESQPAQTSYTISQGNYRDVLSLGETAAYEVNTSRAFNAYFLPTETWSRSYSVELKQCQGNPYVEVSANQRGAGGDDLAKIIVEEINSAGDIANAARNNDPCMSAPDFTSTRIDQQTVELADQICGRAFALIVREGSLERPFTPSSNSEYLNMGDVPIFRQGSLLGEQKPLYTSLGGHVEGSWCKINPNSLPIRAFALNAAGDASTPEQAARNLLGYLVPETTSTALTGTWAGLDVPTNTHSDRPTPGWKIYEDSSNCHWLSDGEIIWKARCDANDIANLYVSLSNSLGVPARRVHVVSEKTDYTHTVIADGGSAQYGTVPSYYDIAEVGLNNGWNGVNPNTGRVGLMLPYDLTLKEATAYDSNGNPINRTNAYNATTSSTVLPLF